MTISEAINTYLLSYSGLTTLVSTRIYPEAAPPDQPDKYVVYHIEIREPEPNLQTTVMLEATLDAVAVSDSYDSAFAIAEQLRLALSYFKGIMGGVGGVDVTGVGFDETVGGYNPDTDRFEATSQFTILYSPA